MTSKDNPPIHQLFTKYLLNEKNRTGLVGEQCKNLWGEISTTIGEAAKNAKKLSENFDYDHDLLEIFKKEIKKNQKRLGILTGETEENIDRLHEGVIETGQQPNCLGGSSLILNKIICAETISKHSNLVPFFSIVDYDGVRGELTNTRLPNISKEGLLIQYTINEAQLETPIYTIRNPSEKWVHKTLKKIKENYKPLLRDYTKRDTIQKNLTHIISLLKYCFYSTENVSEFSTRILGTILNLEGYSAIPFYWHSMPGTRKLFQTAYEDLLAEPTRTKFIQTTNKATEEIRSYGYRPQRGPRKQSYVPFYIECRTCRIRLEPTYCKNQGSTMATLKTKCSECGEQLEYSVNSIKPDLSDIIENISPRVDTRQLINNTVIPIVLRVGGSGENGYFAEVKPVADALNHPFPRFFRYTRIFYNNPWNTEKALKLKGKGFKTLDNPAIYNSIGKWVEARNQDDQRKFALSHNMIQYAVFSTYQSLLRAEKNLENEIKDTRNQLRDREDRENLIKEINKKTQNAREITQYLSWAFGRYNSKSFGQEVTWNWIDLATVVGIEEIVPLYRRVYHEHTPNSSLYYLNL